MNTGNNNFTKLASLSSIKQITPTTVYMLPLIFIFKYAEDIPEYSHVFVLNFGKKEKKRQNIGKNFSLEVRRPDFSSGLTITKYKALRKKQIP